PVHLGSIPHALAATRAAFSNPAPGDIYILNDPYDGGTHLPDIFLIAPVFGSEVRKAALSVPKGPQSAVGRLRTSDFGLSDLAGFVVAVAHHTDVGGRVAGGNACDSTEIYQEGLRLPPLKLY